MLFSSEAVKNKLDYLDAVLRTPALVHQVVSVYCPDGFRLEQVPRYWEPGGGSTLFRVTSGKERFFLKVKHRSVFVESRLELEPEFNRQCGLENEAMFLTHLNSPRVPKIRFFEEREEFCFLALEELEPFAAAVPRMSLAQLLEAWEALVDFARDLHARGIVHTDLHEGNLCFRGESLVVCDFEEARLLDQQLPFEQSLDYCGRNRFGDVGEFPVTVGQTIGGLTCLLRLREVFQSLIRQRLGNFLKECHFDHHCPFNCDALQEEDPRVYQSVDLGGLSVAGQRPTRDRRKNVLSYFLFRQWQARGKKVRHLDLGSNLGIFCLHAAELPFVEQSAGFEAFERYVEAADALRFLVGADNVRFHCFVCGESSFDEAGYGGVELCSMLSVYHHISARESFLAALGQHRPSLLLAEFATQERYYPERCGVEPEIEYIRQHLGYRYAHVLMLSPDYHRPLVLFSDQPLSFMDWVFMCLARSRFFSVGFAVLRLAKDSATRLR